MIIKDIHLNKAISIHPSMINGTPPAGDPGYHQIISTISHELRTPVATIKSNIQLLRKFSYNMEGSILEESFSLCEESVNDVARFLDNIQLLNSVNKSRVHPFYSSFRTKSIIHHLYAWLDQMNLNYHRIELKWDLKDLVIISDKKYLSLLIINILSNALKFSKKKVKFVIRTYHHELSIMVQDWGIGIPEDEIEMIFQPFYRASNATHFSGIGLGLAIVRAMVENLGGRIQVSSTIEKGTIFHIIIPYELSN